jgi:hypothetical protein
MNKISKFMNNFEKREQIFIVMNKFWISWKKFQCHEQYLKTHEQIVLKKIFKYISNFKSEQYF